MLIHGKTANVVGRVCMDQVMLNISGIDGVKVGDEVVIIGNQGEEELTVTEMAAQAKTIHYEIVCLIGKRVPRIYIRNGKSCGITQYVNHTFM